MSGASQRALVVATGRSRGSLAAIRALSAAGWTVGVGIPDAAGMLTRSRHCERSHLVPRPRGDGAPFVEAVRRAVEEGGYDIVFGGGDDWVAALAHFRDQIPTTVAHPPELVVERALDKVALTRHAEAVGWAVPHTEVGTADALDQWEGPVVVKCRAHWRNGQEHAHRIEAKRFPDAGSARPQVEKIWAVGIEPVLQEVIDGRLGALIGIFRDGELLGAVQQETYRLWPTPNGVSTRAQTVAPDPDRVARAAKLLAELDWTGLAELQFLDAAGDEPYLIDLNGRFYGSLALAGAAGPNLADAWARQVLGRPVDELPAGRPGVRFTWGAGDLRRAFAERRQGLVGDVASTLWWGARAQMSVWDRRDLGPTWELMSERIRGADAAAA